MPVVTSPVARLTLALAAACAVLATAVVAGTASAASRTGGAPTEATPQLVADYRFQGNRNSSVAGAPALFNVGPGTNTFAVENVDGNQRTVLRFPAANGVELRSATNVVPRDRYTMAIKLRLDDTSGYRRIVNFVLGSANADRGLYNLAGDLTLSPVSFGSGSPIDPDEWVLVVLTRSAGGRIRGYVDGVAEFDITAPAEARIGPANTLRFFRDDANRQESSGAVARIRLYDRTMTPTQVAALGT
jgi:hypothetical protein